MKRALLVLVGLAVAIQVIRPARTNPSADPSHALTAHVTVPPEVGAIIDRSCRDCHTNDTRWPWYSNVAPASWLVASDVNEGRRHMNFSEWDTMAARRRQQAADRICDQVMQRDMPLPNYLLIHRDARLSDGDIKALCDWSQGTLKRAVGTKPD